ncbi:MAG: SAM-dependent methyltransferase, partial [Thermoanaerobaculia bacterium]
MCGGTPLGSVLRNMLHYGDLSFRDFMEVAMYHPEFGYYSRPGNPIGRVGDYVTAPLISPAFSFALGGLIREFLSRAGDEQSSVVDVGCGDGSLIHSLYASTAETDAVRFAGVDRSLERVHDDKRSGVAFATGVARLARATNQLVFANELFDAMPFARLVGRGDDIHELWVTERDGQLDWAEHEASFEYAQYFADRGIVLAEGQFADVSLDWTAAYEELCSFVTRGLIVTFDYGFTADKLFDRRARRFGTAAAYAQHRVTRDLLANPGEQDLTCHINFSDLIETGERNGFRTLLFDRQAKFLLSLGITGHELFTSSTELTIATLEEGIALRESREDARRL